MKLKQSTLRAMWRRFMEMVDRGGSDRYQYSRTAMDRAAFLLACLGVMIALPAIYAFIATPGNYPR